MIPGQSGNICFEEPNEKVLRKSLEVKEKEKAWFPSNSIASEFYSFNMVCMVKWN